MKIKISTIIRMIVYFDILDRYHFFYLVTFPKVIEGMLVLNNYTLVSAFLALFSFIIIVVKYKKRINRYYKNIRYYLLFIIIAFISVSIFTLLKYPDQSLYTTIRYGSKLFILFWIPVYIYLFENDYSYKTVFNYMNNVSTIWNCLCIICAVVYILTGSVILHLTTVNIRVFGLRIGMGFLGTAMVLYNFANLYNSTSANRRKSLLRFLLGLVCLVFIQQTRIEIVCVAVCIIIQILFGKKNVNAKVKELVVVSLILVLVFASGMYDKVYSSFARVDIETDNISTSARLLSLDYYYSVIKNSPIFGNGFVFCDTGSPYFYVEHGLSGKAFYGDVGLIGSIAEFGLFALLVLVFSIIRMLKSLKKIGIMYSKNSRIYYYVSSQLTNIILCTVSTLSVLDKGRIAILPVIVALTVYVSNCEVKLNEK